jgi:DNA ligase (NAD+)
MDTFLKRTKDELVHDLDEIHGIGEVMAESIAQFFAESKNRRVIEKLRAAGLNPKQKAMTTDGPLKGLAFCITGTLSRSRDEVKNDILRAGGKWTPSVGKGTHYLVAGENVGATKLEAARKKGIKVIDEQALYKMI